MKSKILPFSVLIIRKLIIAAALSLATFNLAVSAVDSETNCLAKAIYFEARGESNLGKVAVAKVVLNRVNSPKFPNTVCGVVYQKHQFSWTKKPTKIVNQQAWAASVSLANKAITTGLPKLKNFTALYFHSKSVKPNWKLTKIAKIGNHVFYA